MTITSTCRLHRKVLLVAMLIGFMGPQLALADDQHERALEARVAELERMVNQLVAQQKAQQAAAPAARPAAPAGARPIQETTLTPGANSADTTVKIGGFVMTDFLATRTSGGTLADSAVSRDLYQPAAIPVGGKSSSTLYDAHAKFSRFNVGIDSKNDAGDKYGAFFEWDFEGNALGSEVTTNLQGATLRHGYVYWNKWLAGQTWTNFMDPAALPEAVDFIGPTDGTVFVRQAQIRYTSGGLSLSAENPENTFVDNKGVVTSFDRSTVPDFTARYEWKGSWGFFGIAGMLRQLRYEGAASPFLKKSESGGALSAMGRWNLGANDDLRYAVTAGDAMARYIGLGVAADAEIDPVSGDIDTRSGYAGYLAWRHAFNIRLRFNLMYAGNHFSNDSEFALATKSTESFRLNLIYSPLPKLDVGAEFMYGKRELESGVNDDLKRIEMMVKYSF